MLAISRFSNRLSRSTITSLAFLLLLFPTLSLAAEQQSFQGRFEWLIIDSFTQGPRDIFFLHSTTDGAIYEVQSKGVEMSHFRNGDELRIIGEVSGSKIIVDNSIPTHSIKSIGHASTLSFGAPLTRSVGILIAESNDQSAPATTSQMRGILWQSPLNVAGWYTEATGAQVVFPPNTDGDSAGSADVFGPFHINYNIAGACDTYTWRNATIAAAQAAGVNTSQYQHMLVLLPRGSSCGYAGIASTACSTGCAVTVYGEYWYLQDVWAHEMGHNFGLGHAGYDEDNNGLLDDHGIYSQYMDHSCVMGEAGVGFRHFNGANKGEMSWLPEARISTITSSGTYKIAALERDPAALDNDKLQLVRFAYSGKVDTYFYLSYRAQLGNYSAQLEEKYRNKVNIHWKGPASLTYFIKGLIDGEQFQDPAHSVCVTQLNHSETEHYATVNVNFGCQDTTPPAAPAGLKLLN